MIRAQNLRKRFEGRDALSGLSFSVDAGEIYGLIGPNGAGKTTTLRILVGLMLPDSGLAEIGGFNVAEAAMQAKGAVGFVTGTAGLYGRLTAREVLVFFSELHRMSPEVARERLRIVERALGLSAFLDRRCEKLSTGEKQRVSLARAMLHNPKVLILDEPTSGLDVLASRFLREAILAEQASGKAILYTTHYLAEAELICTRIGLLHRGRLLAEGTPLDLRRQTGAQSLEEAFLMLCRDDVEEAESAC